MARCYYVYMLASRSRNLYTGVTNSLRRRIIEHREGSVPGFTTRYRIFRLVHFEVFAGIRHAIAREKEIKSWGRKKKVRLIQCTNQTWRDLAAEWVTDFERQRAALLAAEGAKEERRLKANGGAKAGIVEAEKGAAESMARSQETADPSPRNKGGSG